MLLSLRKRRKYIFWPQASAQGSGGLSLAPRWTRSCCQTKSSPGFEPRVSRGQFPTRDNEKCALRTGPLFIPYIYIPDWGLDRMIAQEDNGVINLYPRLGSPCQLPIWMTNWQPCISFHSACGAEDRAPLAAALGFSRGRASWVTLGQASWAQARVLSPDLARSRAQANMDLLACDGGGNSCLSLCLCGCPCVPFYSS